MLLQLPDSAGRVDCADPPCSLTPRGKENQAHKTVSWSRMSPSLGSTEAAEQTPCEELLSAQLMQRLEFFSVGLKTGLKPRQGPSWNLGRKC